MMTCKKLEAITLPCPCCGTDEAGISIRLAQLDGDAFCCGECDGEFSAEFVRQIISRWTKVLAWIDAVPQFADEDE